MPDPVVPPAANAANQDPSKAGNPAVPGDQAPVSREEFNALMEGQTKLQRHLNSLSAGLRRGEIQPGDDPPAPAPKGKLTEDEQLRQDVKDLRERERKHAENSRRSGIATAIAENGLSGEDAELFAAYVHQKFGDKIALNDQQQVVYRETSIDDPKPVKDFVAGLLKGSLGNRFKPAVRTPNTPRGGGALPVPGEAPGLSDMSEEDRAKMDGAASAKKLASGPFGQMLGLK